MKAGHTGPGPGDVVVACRGTSDVASRREGKNLLLELLWHA